MKRCQRVTSLSYLERGDVLFEYEEAARWLTVDRLLSAFTEFTGNGPIAGWVVTAVGLNLSVALGVGFASKVVGRTIEATTLVAPDDTISYVYARFDDSEILDIGEMDPEYSATDVEIAIGSSLPANCAHIATVTATSGLVTIEQQDYLTLLGDLLEDALEEFYAHVHDGSPVPKVDLSDHVTGLLDGSHLSSIDGSLITGTVSLDAVPLLNHIGLWYFPLEVTKEFLTTEDYLVYDFEGVWPVGAIPTVWRNSVVVDQSEYAYDQDTRTITFLVKQNIGAEIEVATEYKEYSADITIGGREDVTFVVYKNGKRVTNYTVEIGDDVVTYLFSTNNESTDELLVCARNYFLTGAEPDHTTVDDGVSELDTYLGLNESEIVGLIVSQDKIAQDHISSIDYDNLLLFTFGVDEYDDGLSTIPEPDVVNKYVEIPAGSINDLYPEWEDGEHNRTREVSGNLELDIRGAAINLVIDQSDSMSTSDPTNIRIDAAKELVTLFMEKVPGTLFNVIGFSSEVTRYTDEWTSDVDIIFDAIDQCATLIEFTNYRDAVVLAAECFDEVDMEYCKATVLLTDGVQFHWAGVEMNHTVQDGIDLHIAASPPFDTPIYSVGLGSAVSKTDLLQYSRGTGGVFFFCASAEAMDELGDFILYGDDSKPRIIFSSGHWMCEHDFTDDRKVLSVAVSPSVPTGCVVKLGYSYSEEGKVWSREVVGGELANIDVVARYWRFYVHLYGYGGNSPSVPGLTVEYVEPSPVELWLNPVNTDVPLFECLFTAIVEPYPESANVELAVHHSGALTWDSCDYITKFRGDAPYNLWRSIVESAHYGSFRFVVRFTNLNDDVMRVHDFSIMYSKRGVY